MSKRISELTAFTPASSDVFPAIDGNTNTTKKVAFTHINSLIATSQDAQDVIRDIARASAIASAIATEVSDRNAAIATAVGGAWVDIAYDSANFTGNGSMTWTVDSGDVLINRFCIINKLAVWVIRVITSSIGGSLNTLLLAKAPALPGTLSSTHFGSIAMQPTGVNVLVGSANQLAFQLQAGGNFPSATNTYQVWGTLVAGIF